MNSKEIDVIDALKSKNLNQLEKQIKSLVLLDVPLSKVHLYLGILNELQGKSSIAMRNYRASIALDGTLVASINNLYRLGENRGNPIDFGGIVE